MGDTWQPCQASHLVDLSSLCRGDAKASLAVLNRFAAINAENFLWLAVDMSVSFSFLLRQEAEVCCLAACQVSSPLSEWFG
jgi:hypothetical protein